MATRSLYSQATTHKHATERVPLAKITQLQQPAWKKAQSIHQWKKNKQGRGIICTDDRPALRILCTADTRVQLTREQMRVIRIYVQLTLNMFVP